MKKYVLPLALSLGLIALESNGQTIIVFENFNSGIPAGWDTTNAGSCNEGWTLGNYLDIDGTQCIFALSWDTVTSTGCIADANLKSSSFNGSAYSTLILEFDHVFADWSTNDSGSVELWNGTDWYTLASFTVDNSAHQTFDITQYKSSNMQIDFQYYGIDDDAWGIDNFKVTGTIGTSINESGKASIKVAPNPSDGRFMVTGATITENIGVFNLLGQRVSSLELNDESELDLRDLPTGIYNIELISHGRFYYKMIVIR